MEMSVVPSSPPPAFEAELGNPREETMESVAGSDSPPCLEGGDAGPVEPDEDDPHDLESPDSPRNSWENKFRMMHPSYGPYGWREDPCFCFGPKSADRNDRRRRFFCSDHGSRPEHFDDFCWRDAFQVHGSNLADPDGRWRSYSSDGDSKSVGAGLRNMGNTCYLNSVLQCIIHTVPLVEKLHSLDHHHPNPGDDSGFCCLCALGKLFESCMAMSGESLTPSDFTGNLRKLSPDFGLGGQQDAHEFLLCLLDSLHNCCLEPSSDDQPSSMDKDSLVKHVFGGRSISQLRCSECGHVSNTPEPLLDLSLEITDADTIIDALASFTKVEMIEETKFTCEGCNSQVLKEKQTKIDLAPSVISLHLKRFRNDGVFTSKIEKFVDYPLELELRPFICYPKDEEQTVYDLYAVLVHKGVASFGHYNCYIRSSPETWHFMDDSKVRRVSETTVLEQMAYILFYVKQGSSPWFSDFIEGLNITNKENSPISVLDQTVSHFSPAEETSNSGSLEMPEKEEPYKCPDISSDTAINHHEFDHPPSTSHACDVVINQEKHQTVLRNSSQGQCTTSNVDDVFHDEIYEDDKENGLMPRNMAEDDKENGLMLRNNMAEDDKENGLMLRNNMAEGDKENGLMLRNNMAEDDKENGLVPRNNAGSNKKETKVKAASVQQMMHADSISGSSLRLMRGMPSNRRASLMACLPEQNHVSKRSHLRARTDPVKKRRQTTISGPYSSDRNPRNRKSSAMASTGSFSPDVRRSLWQK